MQVTYKLLRSQSVLVSTKEFPRPEYLALILPLVHEKAV